ncbi:MAG: hypothetical protein JJ938_07580 [Roseicyclus sp.]|nr:hypothetical protein [Roseicyclus sp.]MBO6624724.1 hypothetical protein [Roseicyclus sp.]MBO6923402.1 hypothetical protein [Roseicyclus sp.]
MRLLRTIQLDQSDKVVFAQAAEPGEWAVPGTFVFAGRPPESLGRKEQIAFRSGFLGVTSFGWSTLAVVTETRGDDHDQAVTALAHQLVQQLGAPDLGAALPAAQEEIALAADLCRGHDEGTLIALHRRIDETGALREQFRSLKPREETAFSAGYLQGHDKAFHFVETEDDQEDEPGMQIDLTAFGRREGEP